VIHLTLLPRLRLAKDFQLNPKMILESWELALECHGLALGTGVNPLVTVPRTLSINLSSTPSVEGYTFFKATCVKTDSIF